MELPAPLSRTGGEAYTDARQDALAKAGPPPRRPPSFYSSVFAQVRQPLDEMPALTDAARKSVLNFFGFLFPHVWVGDIVHFLFGRLRVQIEEIGWEQVVSATGDDGVSCLTFRVV
jgi:E3 ubiquitin-protein ligase FANCL